MKSMNGVVHLTIKNRLYLLGVLITVLLFTQNASAADWSHISTNQADFLNGTLMNVDATTEGDLYLLRSRNNIATGCSYTKSHVPSAKYSDTNNLELTDGMETKFFNNQDGQGMGYQAYALGGTGNIRTLDIIVDLGNVCTIASAELHSGALDSSDETVAKHYEADVLEVYTSTDGNAFEKQGEAGELGKPSGRLTVDFSPIQARYVKYKVTKQFGPSSEALDWLFIDEIYVYSDGYLSQGSFTSPVLQVAPNGIAQSSNISWNGTLNGQCAILVETRVSHDGGATWSEWRNAENGAPIAALDGARLRETRIQYRVVLSTADPTVSPVLHDVTISVQFDTDTVPPSPPAELNATPTGPYEIILTWAANTEADLAGYRIYRNGALVAEAEAYITSWTDRNLAPETSYTYELTAVDVWGNESARSEAVTVITPTLLNPVLTARVDNRNIFLSWTGTADECKVLVNGKEVVTTTETTYSLSDMSPGAYTLQVVAVRGTEQFESNIVNVTVSKLTMPPAAQQAKDILGTMGGVVGSFGSLIALALALKGSPLVIGAVKAALSRRWLK